jgi:hypothetical protein
MHLRHLMFLSLWLLLASAACAAPPGTAARAEIDALLAALGDSGCTFERNGEWHDADAARAHLQRKLAQLLKRDAVATAEDFIERAATRSSISGSTYRVKCGDAAAVTSADWLSQRLTGLRKARD